MEWNDSETESLISLREQGKGYSEIANILGTTTSSVKHKYIRYKQQDNRDEHHHPIEKTEQILRVLPKFLKKPKILELNCGWGNLTEVFNSIGEVTALDIDLKRVISVSEKFPHVKALKCDSFIEVHKLIHDKNIYDVVDIDPYGFPSRYFPHIYQLMKDGFLFVTFPKIGSQQLNKITIAHYKLFWDVDIKQENIIANYLAVICEKLKKYGLFYYRVVTVLDVVDLGRMYRIALKVRKESALDVVGLTVARNKNIRME